MICFECKGSGQLIVPFNRECPFITCYRCHGVGEIPDEAWKWVEEGKLLFEARTNKRCTLKDASKQTGVAVETLSEMEGGIIEPNLEVYNKLVLQKIDVSFKEMHVPKEVSEFAAALKLSAILRESMEKK